MLKRLFGFCRFSAMPLRLSIFWGLFVTACGIGYGVYSIFAAYVLNKAVPGWTSLVCLNVIFSGTTMIAIGLVGEYVARIYEEAKGRPLYVVARTANCDASSVDIPGAVVLPTGTPVAADFEAPSYSAVRAMLRLLEQKGYVRHEQDGPRYVFKPMLAREKARRSALKQMLQTFFDGSTGEAVAALLDLSRRRMSKEELDHLSQLIEEAKKEGR